MHRTRVISGLIMAAGGIVILLAGGRIAGCVLLILSLLSYFELCRACKVLDRDKPVNAASLFGYLAIIAYYINIMWGNESYVNLVSQVILLVFLLAQLAVYVFTFPRFNTSQISASVFNVMYAPFMLSFLYFTLRDFGIYITFSIFIASCFSDVFAYTVGRKLGRHKLAPKLSPKKSIEGSIGGIVGAALVGLIYGFILYKAGIYGMEALLIFTLIGGLGSVVSQVGDLAASAIKRDHDIKDYSKIIPGHGGIMDRMDSITVTAPIIYLLAVALIK